MRVLITNDDGIQAEGIAALVAEISSIADVIVIAPDRERSATGHAITMHYPLRVFPQRLFGETITAFSTDGTPVDCVKLGLQALLSEPPDMVLSGINRGSNLGTDVMYSGTVSAAIEGTMLGVPSIAFSICAFRDCRFHVAARIARHMVQEVARRELPPDTLLNVNFPNVDLHELKGIKVTRLGVRRYKDVFEERKDPRGRRYFWMAGVADDAEDQEGSDVAAINESYVSVTPVHFDLTRFEVMKEIAAWNLNLLDLD